MEEGWREGWREGRKEEGGGGREEGLGRRRRKERGMRKYTCKHFRFSQESG